MNDFAHKGCWAGLRASISWCLQMAVDFLQLRESCMERVGWKMPVVHLPESKSAKLSTIWDLFGEAGKDSSIWEMVGLEQH